MLTRVRLLIAVLAAAATAAPASAWWCHCHPCCHQKYQTTTGGAVGFVPMGGTMTTHTTGFVGFAPTAPVVGFAPTTNVVGFVGMAPVGTTTTAAPAGGFVGLPLPALTPLTPVTTPPATTPPATTPPATAACATAAQVKELLDQRFGPVNPAKPTTVTEEIRAMIREEVAAQVRKEVGNLPTKADLQEMLNKAVEAGKKSKNKDQ
jgi:hypothetical protein